MAIRISRAYDRPSPDDGIRILVDRFWPRGLSRERLQITDWMKEIAPSNALRQLIHHDPSQWDIFVAAYYRELDANPQAVQTLLEFARKGSLTLIYGARDQIHNQAVVLKQYLEEHLQ